MGMLDQWLKRAEALNPRMAAKIGDFVMGSPTLKGGNGMLRSARVGGLFGEGGAADKTMGAASAMKDKIGSGADAAEKWIDDHPHLSTAGAGLFGGVGGGALVHNLENQDDHDQDDDDRIIERIERRRNRGG